MSGSEPRIPLSPARRFGLARAPEAGDDVGPVEVYALVQSELQQVEELFRENLASPVRIVDKLGEFVADGGGKRVRPVLHLLCSKMLGAAGPHSVLLATVLEFIHSATLIHDDVIDGATTRRGRDSVNYSWGNNLTVLFGDYLFAKAMEMALRLGSLEVMKELAEVTLRMTEGEMLQTRYAGRADLGRDEYLDLVERKTAALFGCSCELAGVLAGVDPERRSALRRYGVSLGMAFQLVDDLLDLTGNAARMGKPSASDLREGKVTLAVIDLLSGEDDEARDVTAAIMNGSGDDQSALARLRSLLRSSGALARTQRLAGDFALAAQRELDAFEDGPAWRALHALPGLLLARDR